MTFILALQQPENKDELTFIMDPPFYSKMHLTNSNATLILTQPIGHDVNPFSVIVSLG